MSRSVLALVALILSACSAGTGGDWPGPPKGVLADCVARGDRCGGSGYCGPTRADVLTCCPVSLDAEGYCPGAEAPGITECEVDTDCAEAECHERAQCLGGVCFAAPLPALAKCNGAHGLCDAAGACGGCLTDAECDAQNTDDCRSGACEGGLCQFHQLAQGTPCRLKGGICDEGAYCAPQ
jgi:hypothetical protein